MDDLTESEPEGKHCVGNWKPHGFLQGAGEGCGGASFPSTAAKQALGTSRPGLTCWASFVADSYRVSAETTCVCVSGEALLTTGYL